MRTEPYRVIVWGPGGVGRACLREMRLRPEFEIAGVLAFSEDKHGKDVGELLGQPPMGIQATTDKEAIFALDADAVLWTGMLPFDAQAMERDVIRLLESGKHVISSAAFHYAHNRGPDYVEKFEAACRKGKACLHGTGENPGFWYERLALTLTGITNDVESMKLSEFADISTSGSTPELLAGLSIGATPEQAAVPGPMSALWQDYYFVEVLNMTSIALFGRALDRVDHTPKYHVAEHDVVLSRTQGDTMDLIVPQGRISALAHTFTGVLDGQPRLSISLHWFLGQKHCPFPVKTGDSWLVEIEGRPVSLRCQINAFASLIGDLAHLPGDNTSSTWYATAVPMIQAIPVLCGHEPGIVYPTIFTHSSSDFRHLQGRKSIAG